MFLALGLGGSTAALAADDTGNAPGGTGVEQSTAGHGATDKQGGVMPRSGAGASQMKGVNSTDQGGTGIKGSAAGRGATDKSTEDTGPDGLRRGNVFRQCARRNRRREQLPG